MLRRNDIENFKKEVYEIENLDKTIKERKSTLKHSIELLDDIIAENNISNANLHLMFDKIIINETDERNLSIIQKAKSATFSIYLLISCTVVIITALMDMPDVAKWIGYSQFVLVIIYWICYFIYQKKS